VGEQPGLQACIVVAGLSRPYLISLPKAHSASLDSPRFAKCLTWSQVCGKCLKVIRRWPVLFKNHFNQKF